MIVATDNQLLTAIELRLWRFRQLRNHDEALEKSIDMAKEILKIVKMGDL